MVNTRCLSRRNGSAPAPAWLLGREKRGHQGVRVPVSHLVLGFEDDPRNVMMLRAAGVPCVYLHSGYYG